MLKTLFKTSLHFPESEVMYIHLACFKLCFSLSPMCNLVLAALLEKPTCSFVCPTIKKVKPDSKFFTLCINEISTLCFLKFSIIEIPRLSPPIATKLATLNPSLDKQTAALAAPPPKVE